MTRAPDVSSLLSSLTRDRLVEIGQTLGVSVPARARKERQIETLLGSAQLRFATLLGMLHRDELKGACRLSGLDDGGRGRSVLARRLSAAAGEGTAEPASLFAGEDTRREVPRPGQLLGDSADQGVESPQIGGDGSYRTADPADAGRSLAVGGAPGPFHLIQRLLYTKWRDPRAEPKLHLFGQLKSITCQWLDDHLVCKGGTYPAQLITNVQDGQPRIFKGSSPARRLLAMV